ncbi:MAG: hypothetical protein GY803_05100, partial [Chloroflexi bacterium]|nr:hypothetical protein [Chloroflexota bacterium]
MLYIVLRLIHIIAGVFWAGAGLMNVGFVSPAAKKAGPEGGKFMQTLVQQTQFSHVMDIAAILTILSGSWLIWIISGGFQLEWLATRKGLSLTIGGLTAIIAYALAWIIIKPTLARIGQLGKEMASAGGPPGPEQIA